MTTGTEAASARCCVISARIGKGACAATWAHLQDDRRALSLGGGDGVPHHILDRFLACLSYCLHLLIGFNAVKVNHGRRLTATGSVRALVVVKSDPMPDAAPCLRPCLPRRADKRIHERQRRSMKMLSMQRPLPSGNGRCLRCKHREALISGSRPVSDGRSSRRM